MKIEKLTPTLIISVAAAIFFGCSKDENPGETDNKKAKITLSVSSAFSKADGDDFQFHVGGATTAGTSVDWKVQGEVEKAL